jgi:YbbR domain-containing protein
MLVKKLFFGNLGFKLIALFGALALWFFITYRGQSETAIEAQIDFKNIPAGLEILKQNVKKVNVGVRGHEMILGGLRPSDVRVVVDLSSGKKGESSYFFDVNDVKVLQNVQVKRIEPNSVRVTLDESVSRDVNISPYVIGEPAAGFAVRKIVVAPAHVSVEGARTEMARLAVLRTDPLDITGLSSSISQNIRLDTNGRNVRLKDSEVAIRVLIGRKK